MEIQSQHRVPGRRWSTLACFVIRTFYGGHLCKPKRKDWIVFTILIGTMVLAVFYGLAWHNKPAMSARLTHKDNKPKWKTWKL
jgi:hypothetical protein